jgi:haloalkane dehalogenase
MENVEIDAYIALLKREDGGRAFLRIMRGFELTEAKQDFFYKLLQGARRTAVPGPGGMGSTLLPARHFLQEDRAPSVAAAVAEPAEREEQPDGTARALSGRGC